MKQDNLALALRNNTDYGPHPYHVSLVGEGEGGGSFG